MGSRHFERGAEESTFVNRIPKLDVRIAQNGMLIGPRHRLVPFPS